MFDDYIMSVFFECDIYVVKYVVKKNVVEKFGMFFV